MKHYQLTPTDATCPICASENARLLWSVNSDEAAQHYVLKEVDPQRFQALSSHIKSLWQQETCEVVQCEDCGFGYSHPYVAGDDKFYRLAYDREGYPRWKWEHQLSYDALKQRKTGFTLLEVGAGDGAFVKGIAPALTAKENLLCTEYSDYGQQQIADYGIQCLSTDVRSIQLASSRPAFDAICLFQVVEHLDNLEALFEQLNRLTHADSSLFISVPSPKLIEFAELNDGLLDMPPNHIGRWNRSCFDKISQRWGWTVEDYAIEDNSFIAKAELFCKYKFWRQGQRSGTLANRVLQVKHPSSRKLMQLGVVGLYGLASLMQMTALQSPEFGFSQWVHLRKI